MRSVHRVAQRVNRSNQLGAKAFTTIGYKILEAKEQNEIATLFEVLKGGKSIADAMKLLPQSKMLQQYSSQHRQHDWDEWIGGLVKDTSVSLYTQYLPVSHKSTNHC